MKSKHLVTEAYKSAHFAAELSEKLHEQQEKVGTLDADTTHDLLEQARCLNAAAQALDNIARGMPQPKEG